MTTVIGLKSGKEFVVKDQAYFFTLATTGVVVTVFESIDGKRLITIPDSTHLEYFDEPKTPERVADLKGVAEAVKEPEVEHHDVNVG